MLLKIKRTSFSTILGLLIVAAMANCKIIKENTIDKSNLISFPKEAKKEVTIVVDISRTLGPLNRYSNGIGMGSFHDGITLKHHRSFFKLLQQTNQQHKIFSYVNTKCIFLDEQKNSSRDDGAHIVQQDESGQITYHWQIVDLVLDTLLSFGLKPIISLTFMPEALASNPDRRNPWNKGVITPPRDYNQWRELVYQTIKHVRERYGSEEIRQWYFEVWNEPDLPQFSWIPHPKKPYKGDNKEYFKLYDYTVDGALSADSSIKIGGPAIAGDLKLFLEDFLKHCLYEKNHATGKIGTRIDFLSRHIYGAIEEEVLPEYKNFIDKAKEIGGNLFDNLEIIITETGPHVFPQEWLNTRYVATWIIKEFDAMLYLNDNYGSDYLPDILCFWTKPVVLNFGDHFGLVTVLGDQWRPDPDAIVKRPAFNGYEILSHLGDERIELTGTNFGDFIHGIATKKDESEIAILLYHLNDWDQTNTDTIKYKIDLCVNNLPFEKFYLAEYRIDENHSNGYAVWREMGSPTELRPKHLEYLKAHDDLERSEPIAEIESNSQTFNTELYVQSNSVVLLMLSINKKNGNSSPP